MGVNSAVWSPMNSWFCKISIWCDLVKQEPAHIWSACHSPFLSHWSELHEDRHFCHVHHSPFHNSPLLLHWKSNPACVAPAGLSNVVSHPLSPTSLHHQAPWYLWMHQLLPTYFFVVVFHSVFFSLPQGYLPDYSSKICIPPNLAFCFPFVCFVLLHSMYNHLERGFSSDNNK